MLINDATLISPLTGASIPVQAPDSSLPARIASNAFPVFLSTVTGVSGGGASKLDGIATAGSVIAVNTLVCFMDGAELAFYLRKAENAAEDAPGIVLADDHNTLTNPGHWLRVK